MPFESVGNGFSVGSQPDYAQLIGNIQNQNASRFDQYTNPFLNSRGVQGEILPWLENAQNQGYRKGMLSIDQARQNMAQTAQDTLLPLQANKLNADTAGLQAQAAMQNFQLNRMQDSASQMPSLLSGISDAEANSDPAALFQAGASNPAAFAANPSIMTDSLNRLSQQQEAKTTGIIGSAASRGADYVSQNPNSSVEDISSSYQPSDGLNPAQQQQEKNAYIQGATHQQVQANTASIRGTLQLAAAEVRANGSVKAATQKTLGPLIQKGFMTPEALAAVGIDPDTADKLMAATVATPDASGNVVPDKVAVANIGMAKSILANPTATTTEKNWAYSAMNNGGAPAFALPVYPPPVQDKLDLLDDQMKRLKDSLPQRSTMSMFGKSDYDKTNDQITDLKNQIYSIKNNFTPPSQNQPQQQSLQTPSTFGNPFMGDTQSYTIPGNPDTSAAMTESIPSTVTVPGNPMTQSAINASLPSTPVSTPKAPVKSLPPISPQDIPPAKEWLVKHPTDPQAPAIRERLRAYGVTGI